MAPVRRTALKRCQAADSPLPWIGSYRALASTANIFARESHMDDLAHAAGMDPLAFRLKNLKDARLRAVLEAAAEKFGWGRSQPAPGHGFGLACGTEKGSYLATCAEVAVERPSGQVKVVRAGQIVQSDILTAHLTEDEKAIEAMELRGHSQIAMASITRPHIIGYS